MVAYVGLDVNGMIGNILQVAVLVVIPYTILGQVLARTGGADFFSDIAMSAMGRYRGGAILPGLETSAKALAEKARRLFEVPLEAPDRATQPLVRTGPSKREAVTWEAAINLMVDRFKASHMTAGEGEFLALDAAAQRAHAREIPLRGLALRDGARRERVREGPPRKGRPRLRAGLRHHDPPGRGRVYLRRRDRDARKP